jgi:tetratricopeptide (TPR) repeat protein
VSSPPDPDGPEMLRLYDEYGREVFGSRAEWRDSVLPHNLQAAWNDADQLAGLVVGGLQDRFFEEMRKPARRLAEIDANFERSAVLLAIVLLETGRVDESERVLQRHLAAHGESGVALTNLAKVHDRRGDRARALETLRRGLEVDPNQDMALSWYQAERRQDGGPEAAAAALRDVAAVRGSWRAQTWLARAALQRGDLEAAVRHYDEGFASAGEPAPADLLAQMSGDLGQAGRLREIVDLVLPRYRVGAHGLAVGNNLVKALVELNAFEQAAGLVEELHAQGRPDWAGNLGYWDTEIARARLASAPVRPAEELSVTLLRLDGPVWLPEDSPAHALFPPRGEGGPAIVFVGSTAATGARGTGAVPQLSDARGRLSRALPVFLAEQIHFAARADVSVLVPWAQAGGFVLIGGPWPEPDAVRHAQEGGACTFVVITHIDASGERWRLSLRLVRCADAALIGSAEAFLPAGDPRQAPLELARRAKALIADAGVHVRSLDPPEYQVPSEADFADYLLRLEQLLAVRGAGMPGASAASLNGEHEILDGNLGLCLRQPRNPTVRILLLQTWRAMRRARPKIAGAYRAKLDRLMREHPLPEPAQAIARRLLDEEAAAG